MNPIPITKARKNLYKIANNTLESHQPTIITTINRSVVLLSFEDWSSRQETEYLKSTPRMMESIQKGMK
jgi:antitoxin YefM